jgi:hypothetical protein
MKQFNKQIQTKFDEICKTGKLFRVNLSGDAVWQLYLQSFPKEHNPVFRDPASTEHNCNHCKNFVRRYGNIVSINEKYEIETMFDVDAEEEYKDSAKAMSAAIKKATISEVFFETFNELNSLPYESCSKSSKVFQLGVDKNVKRYTREEAEKYGVVKPDQTITFNHMHLSIPKEFVDMTGKSVEAIMGEYRDAKNVFQRAMETISLDTLNLVKDLINQGSLLDGTTHLYKIEQIIPLKQEYDSLTANQRDNWCWVKSYKLPFAKFRNELIGVLCSELSEGKELNDACQSRNKRVDPANYMKATAPITKKQIEEAKKFVEENGYEESFDRRFAVLEDIKVSEILHTNAGDGKIKNASIFDTVKSTSTRHKRSEFDKVEEIGIDKFMKDILPTCTSVEAFLTNGHEGNMVTLTTAKNPESKPIFKWNNNYSWTFNGNLAGKSQIKENVKAVGGKTTGAFRCSLQWNDADTIGIVDLDLHCKISGIGEQVYYGNKRNIASTTWLDIDMINPHHVGIENMTIDKLVKDGTYQLFVHNFSGHTNFKGFKAEIEYDGNTFEYAFLQPFTGNKAIATITITKGVITDIQHELPESTMNKEIYGLETNNFHKVNVVCLSPNHWGDNNVGNKHYLFMLDGCKSPISLRSFHNENLIPELAQHRKVLEVLGTQTMIESKGKQLSGLGFNATVRDELVVRLQGTHKRVVKIKF